MLCGAMKNRQQNLKLTESTLSKLLSMLQDLRSLNLSYSPVVTDSIVAKIAKCGASPSDLCCGTPLLTRRAARMLPCSSFAMHALQQQLTGR
jgi:hypothetical protein